MSSGKTAYAPTLFGGDHAQITAHSVALTHVVVALCRQMQGRDRYEIALVCKGLREDDPSQASAPLKRARGHFLTVNGQRHTPASLARELCAMLAHEDTRTTLGLIDCILNQTPGEVWRFTGVNDDRLGEIL